MTELKNKVEALLFAVGKHIDIEEIGRITGEPDKKQVEKRLSQIQQDYNERESPIMVISEGNSWKLTVREKYLDLVKNLVAETELSKTILETLAVIAWKNPVKQSDVIRIRTNKAYDHVQELEDLGFLSREKFGRTMLLKLTDKFFNYFELTGNEDIREVFKKVGVEDQTQKKVDEYSDDERVGDLQVYEETPKQKKEREEREALESKTKLGNLQVVDAGENESKDIEDDDNSDEEVTKTDIHEPEDDASDDESSEQEASTEDDDEEKQDDDETESVEDSDDEDDSDEMDDETESDDKDNLEEELDDSEDEHKVDEDESDDEEKQDDDESEPEEDADTQTQEEDNSDDEDDDISVEKKLGLSDDDTLNEDNEGYLSDDDSDNDSDESDNDEKRRE